MFATLLLPPQSEIVEQRVSRGEAGVGHQEGRLQLFERRFVQLRKELGEPDRMPGLRESRPQPIAPRHGFSRYGGIFGRSSGRIGLYDRGGRSPRRRRPGFEPIEHLYRQALQHAKL